MGTEDRNPLLNVALGLMDTAVPGMFEDPRAAWRDHVARLRYVVIERCEHLTTSQLKTVQAFATSFHACAARNLVEVRRALSSGPIRLEAVPLEFAQVNLQLLRAEGIGAHLVELSDEERREKLQLLDELPPMPP